MLAVITKDKFLKMHDFFIVHFQGYFKNLMTYESVDYAKDLNCQCVIKVIFSFQSENITDRNSINILIFQINIITIPQE